MNETKAGATSIYSIIRTMCYITLLSNAKSEEATKEESNGSHRRYSGRQTQSGNRMCLPVLVVHLVAVLTLANNAD